MGRTGAIRTKGAKFLVLGITITRGPISPYILTTKVNSTVGLLYPVKGTSSNLSNFKGLYCRVEFRDQKLCLYSAHGIVPRVAGFGLLGSLATIHIVNISLLGTEMLSSIELRFSLS